MKENKFYELCLKVAKTKDNSGEPKLYNEKDEIILGWDEGINNIVAELNLTKIYKNLKKL